MRAAQFRGIGVRARLDGHRLTALRARVCARIRGTCRAAAVTHEAELGCSDDRHDRIVANGALR